MHSLHIIHFSMKLRFARINGMLGSVDANMEICFRMDTDQFPTNIYDAVLAMYEILKDGDLKQEDLTLMQK